MDATLTGSYDAGNTAFADDTIANTSTTVLNDQLIAQFIEQINQNRHSEEAIAQLLQNENFIKSLQQIDKVRDFIGDLQHILGNNSTKHGEIAEQVEVAVHNARQALHGQTMTADIDSISRTSPIDYLIDGIPFQSKFINGANSNLNHVLDHLDKYPDFIEQHGCYHIPKDHYETVAKIINGEHIEGLKSTTQNAIKAKVATIEAKTEHSFDEIVYPSVSTYADVQLGNIENTLNNHDANLANENQQIKQNIHADHSANFAEGLDATELSAMINGVISLVATVYQQHKAGKSIVNYTIKDWQSLGLKVGKDAISGGITGWVIYLITNSVGLAAPLAAFLVSFAKAISALLQQYNKGEINTKEFSNLAKIRLSQCITISLCTFSGQVLIPIPFVGALIGAVAGQILVNFTKTSLHADIQQQLAKFTAELNARKQQIFEQIDARFKVSNDLIAAACNTNDNNIDKNSIKLARYLKVSENKIIKNKQQLDDFMLS
jgi:ribosomal protein S8/uncharacterized membrane protein (Fun14 family)